MNDEEGDAEGLRKEEETMYRALVARANDLAQYRVGIQFAVKELCRGWRHQRRED